VSSRAPERRRRSEPICPSLRRLNLTVLASSYSRLSRAGREDQRRDHPGPDQGDGAAAATDPRHPETHVTWHRVAPALADAGYSVIVPDLRGYGDTSKPPYSPDSRNYSFRAMGQDLVEVMSHYGHGRFMAAGHDRGGRVLHRMCLDYPDAVQKAAVLDIARETGTFR
jgi:pimeloyl-ACP methyl ester carboxylesterase